MGIVKTNIMTLEQLKDDYQRRIETVNRMIRNARESKRLRERLIVKRGCYKAFLTELNRVGKQNQ